MQKLKNFLPNIKGVKNMDEILKNIYDNTAQNNGKPNFCIKTESGKTFYVKEITKLEEGDRFTCDLGEKKTSANGNVYYGISNVRKLGELEETGPTTAKIPTPTRTNATISSNEVMMASIGIWTRSAPSICKTVDDVKTYNSAMIDYFKNNLSNGQ